MLLRLTDGTTTLTLSGAGTYLGATYFPTSQAGADRITETVPVILEGTETAIRGAVNDIEQLFAAARTRQRNLTPRVYVEFRPTDSGDIFRAEIFDGAAVYDQDPAKRSLYNTVSTVQVAVAWTRRAKLQGPEEEVYLSGPSQTERLGGVTTYNNDNATATAANWFQAAANRIKGTQPAPIRLRITNASGAGLPWRNFHIGNNVYSSPASADVWLLGSEAVSGAAANWTSGTTHSSLAWIFPLSATLLAQTQGRTFRVLAAFTGAVGTNGYLLAHVGPYIGSTFIKQHTTVGERLAGNQLLDLGELPIPPGGYNVANAGAALVITARGTGSGGGTIDFVQLMPTDSYRKLEQIGYTASNGDAIEDDGIEGGAVAILSGTRNGIVSAAGEPLMVYPERINRFHFLFDEGGNFTAGRQVTVQAWYRPVYDAV